MDNKIAVTDNDVSPYEKWDKQQIETIKKTVAVNATDEELNMFLSLCATYSLDPFAKEIWCIKMGGKAIITTSRDGYLKIANRDPNYEGMTSDVVRAGDKFMKQGGEINHAYSANRGQIIGAYALVYRTDRKVPAYFFAPFDEYCKKDNATWRQYPSAMIIKVAESMALKRAFSISGLVTEEEIGTGQEQKAQQPQEAPARTNSPMNPPMTEAQKNERKIQLKQLYHRYLAVCDNQQNHAFNAMKKITGKDSSDDYTPEDIKALFKDVIEREYQKMDEEVAAQAQAQDAEAIDVQAEEMMENAPAETIPD